MGALGSIVVVALAGRFSFSVLRETALATTRITAGMMFILICAQVFALAFRGLHGEKLVEDLFNVVPGGVNGVLIFMMALIFVLGFFIEWIEISYIVVPLFLPLLLKMNVDLVWVASLIAVNLQTSFLTPPFGWALFYLRSVAPPEVPTLAIYKGVVPFIMLAADRAGPGVLLSRSGNLAAARDRLVEAAQSRPSTRRRSGAGRCPRGAASAWHPQAGHAIGHQLPEAAPWFISARWATSCAAT